MPIKLRLTGFSTPFDEALRFFADKDLVGTRRWDDLWQSEHDRAFMVAGLAKGQMLQDLRDAVRRAIAEGTTLADFRRRFDEVVARDGWPFRADDTGDRACHAQLGKVDIVVAQQGATPDTACDDYARRADTALLGDDA